MPISDKNAVLEIIVRVEAHRAADFLVDVLWPAMEAVRRSGRISRWFFVRHIDAVSGLTVVSLSVRTLSSRKSGIRRLIFDMLRPKLRSKSEGLSVPLAGLIAQKDAEERFGKSQGTRIFERFCVANSRLTIELLKAMRSGTLGITMDRLGIVTMLFLMDALGLPKLRRGRLIKQWLAAFSRTLEQGEQWLAEMQKRARRELEKDAALLELFANCKRGRPSQPGAIWSVLLPHRTSFEGIARSLRLNEPHFSAKRPRWFVIFHSYLHIHLATLGYTALQEMFMTSLIYSWQER